MTGWQKSSFCNGAATCLEVFPLPDGGVAVRDGKLGDTSPVLSFTSAEWAAFLSGVRAGEFDLAVLASGVEGVSAAPGSTLAGL